jgi:hypothetical protein
MAVIVSDAVASEIITNYQLSPCLTIKMRSAADVHYKIPCQHAAPSEPHLPVQYYILKKQIWISSIKETNRVTTSFKRAIDVGIIPLEIHTLIRTCVHVELSILSSAPKAINKTLFAI